MIFDRVFYKSHEARMQAVLRRMLRKSKFKLSDGYDWFLVSRPGNIIKFKFKKSYNLENLKVLWRPTGEVFKIKENYLYRFLTTRDESIYKDYLFMRKKVFGVPEDTKNNIKKFLTTEQDILKNGYDPKQGVIVCDQNGFLLDGNHRASILLAHGIKSAPVLVVYYDS